MIGEIRDPETAQLALRAALSGILVFSTLHTQDSAGAVPRLMDMGLEPYLLASGIVGVIAQRLLRTICPDCKETAARIQRRRWPRSASSPDPGLVFYRGRGCAKCGDTGYRGRTGAMEILVVDHDDPHADSRARRFAADQGSRRARGHEDADGRCAGQGDLRADDDRRSAAGGV